MPNRDQQAAQAAALDAALDRQAREALARPREAPGGPEAWLRLAYAAAGLGTFYHDPLSNVVYFDPRAQGHHGFSRDVMPIAEVLAHVHRDDVSRLEREIAATLDPTLNGRYDTEYRVCLTNGDVNWVAVQAQAFFAGEGATRQAFLVVGTSQDITARKRIEQELRASEAALRASEEHFRLLAEHAQDLIYRYRLAPRAGFEYVSPSATTITGYTPEEHYADPQLGTKLVHPDDLSLLLSLSSDVSAAREPLTLRWLRKDGKIIWTELVSQIIYDADGQPIAIEGIARDITARRLAVEQVHAALAAEQAARAAAEQGAARITRLQAVTAALASAMTRDAVVAVMTGHGAAAAGAGAGVVSLLDPTEQSVEIIGFTGRTQADLEDFRVLPMSASFPVTTAVRNREALWFANREAAEARVPGSAAIMARFGDLAYAALPLVSSGRVIGAISFGFRTPQDFPAEDRAFLTTLAQQCAQALERTRLYGEVLAARGRLQQLSQRLLEAQEQERRAIARELHDEIGQALGALKINLHVMGQNAQIPREAPHYRESLDLLDRLIAQVRAISLDLRPSVLDDLGLVEALEWYCDRFGQRTGIAVSFVPQLHGVVAPPLVATACFRIVQEALTNVIRHAAAHHVQVTLSVRDGMLALGINDDGNGFNVAQQRARAAAGNSLGLISMTERAELAGGWADISSTLGTGTEVWAWFPLDAPADPAAG